MTKRAGIRLGKVQLQIMGFLWQQREATAREITNHLSQTQGIAHSTVQTLLRKLEQKGAVCHEERNRIFVFRALVREADLTAASVHEIVARAFQGSVSGLVAHLLKNEKISKEELAELRSLIDACQEGSK